LEASLLRERDGTAEADALVDKANQMQQARADARQAAADAARAKLMADVTTSRLDQMHQHALCRCGVLSRHLPDGMDLHSP